MQCSHLLASGGRNSFWKEVPVWIKDIDIVLGPVCASIRNQIIPVKIPSLSMRTQGSDLSTSRCRLTKSGYRLHSWCTKCTNIHTINPFRYLKISTLPVQICIYFSFICKLSLPGLISNNVYWRLLPEEAYKTMPM